MIIFNSDNGVMKNVGQCLAGGMCLGKDLFTS